MRKKVQITVEVKCTDQALRKKKISYVTGSFKSYANARHLLFKLDRNSRVFLDYLCEKMDEQNRVYILHNFIAEYCKHVSEITNRTITVTKREVSNSLDELHDLGLCTLIPPNKKSYYRVNPKYFFRGTDGQRLILLRKIIEEHNRCGLSIQPFIDKPEDDFLKP